MNYIVGGWSGWLDDKSPTDYNFRKNLGQFSVRTAVTFPREGILRGQSPKLYKFFQTVTGPSTTVIVLLQSLMVLWQYGKIFLVSGPGITAITATGTTRPSGRGRARSCRWDARRGGQPPWWQGFSAGCYVSAPGMRWWWWDENHEILEWVLKPLYSDCFSCR